MTRKRYQIVISGPEDNTWVSLDSVAQLADLHPGLIAEFARANLIASFVHRGQLYFDQSGIHRLRQIRSLHFDSGISMRTVRLIIGLFDRIEAAETEIEQLRERLRLHT